VTYENEKSLFVRLADAEINVTTVAQIIVLCSAFMLGAARSFAAGPDAAMADAAERQDESSLRALLDQKADANSAQVDGMTALHWAVYHDDKRTAQLLLKAGADVKATNRYGVAPLSLACQNGNAELVELLLSAGADPNTSLPGGETALITAARTGRIGPVKSLISHGADVNAKEHKRQTALMWAAADGHPDVVDALIAAGADVNARLRSGFTSLFFAVREGQSAVTRRLLAAGCDVNGVMRTDQPSRFGRGDLRLTPLLMAVENGHFELAEQLLAAGADPNAEPAGYTALHAISWVRKPLRGDGDPSPIGSGKHTSLDMVRILVAAGADINARFKRGKSELGRFTYSGSTPFLLAAQASDLPLMKLLLELGADPELPNADGTTPLLAAAGVGALGDGDESAGTEEEAIAATEFLLELGADINAVDRNGETAMHGAAYQSRAALVKWLVERGASIDVWNHENRAGWTPLVIALGYRPGNFRPSPATIAAIEAAMTAAGAMLPDRSKLGAHRRVWTGASNNDTPWVMKGVEFARVGESTLLLDLHMPLVVSNSNLVVWAHGGGWRSGSKEDMPLGALVEAGYTVASVDYRLSSAAPFPAQVHDIKAAIRYLRARAARYGYRAERIAIAGASAGGHLAALVGTTNGSHELEGTIGNHLDQSSDVQAVVDYYGPTNFMTILSQSTPHGLNVRVPAVQPLLGGQPDDQPELAKLASPVNHVDKNDPPLLLIHGDQDLQVPINQSHELHGKYKQFALPVRFEVVHGGAHGGSKFYDDELLSVVRDFLDDSLRAQ
jgi:ankyrin repeat protein/acetyl esterase/lipase